MNQEYPTIVRRWSASPPRDFIADGEIVAFENGITSFSRLQRRARERVPVFLYLFDLPSRGRGPSQLPLASARRASGGRSSSAAGCVSTRAATASTARSSTATPAGGASREWSPKRADSPYLSGGRSRDWLKLKCNAEQELVIGGYTAPKGSRIEFGALLVGYYDDSGRSRYAGKVGTGFDHHTLQDVGAQHAHAGAGRLALRALQADPAGHALGRPSWSAQIGFTKWTRDGACATRASWAARRQARRDVVRELPS